MKRRPSQTRNIHDLLRLRSDHFDTEEAWILIDAGDEGAMVYLRNQRTGEESTGAVAIPLEEFNRLVRWYLRPQKLRPAVKETE